MYILLVSATHNEIDSTIRWLNENRGMVNGNEVEVLITGIGCAATAYALMKQFEYRSPEMVIQAGIGGSFRREYAPESIVFIGEEVFADLGAIEGDELVDIFDMGLTGNNEVPYRNRLLVNDRTEFWEKFDIPFVRGATINCISSSARQAERIVRKYDPVIESMEGAALHYTCLMEKVPFVQLRSVSNYAGERDKSRWKMKEAIAVLNDTLRDILLR